jgi:hypothetical protein
MRAPFRAGFGAGFARIAIRREVAWYLVTRRAAFVRESHIQRVIGERIRLRVALTRKRPVQRECDFVPLFQFAADGDDAFAVGLARGNLRLSIRPLSNRPNQRQADKQNLFNFTAEILSPCRSVCRRL